MKRILLLCVLLLSITVAKAQDQIHLKDGTIMEVHVKKINSKNIAYSTTANTPQRFIKKSLVEKVVYKRGREVMMVTPATIAAAKRKSKIINLHNTLTLSPLPLMFWGNYVGIGLGADYERYIGASHRFSVHIPVYLGLIIGPNDDPGMEYNEGTIVYTSPGIRFHPCNPEKRFDYSVGVSGLIGNMNHSKVVTNNTLYPNEDAQFLLAAVTLDNDVNFISPRKKVVFGIHTAVGPVFGDFGDNGKWMVQIGLKIGRRF